MAKKLTAQNWLEPDPVMSVFVQWGPGNHQPHPMPGEDWLGAIVTPTLEESVPVEVRDLFEAARGALAYGYFFYPLYALGMGQLFRVAEAAVAHKCKAMGAPAGVRRFSDRIGWLIGRGIIPEHEKDKWDGTRELRNLESHPERPLFATPAMAIGEARMIADDINSLFRSA